MTMPLSDAVVLVAGAYVGLGEEPRNSNRGQLPKLALASVGLNEGHPWCAAFVYLVGTRALGAAWPCPRTARVQELYEWARDSGRVSARPIRGDLFVLWYPTLKRYGHVGFVERVEGTTVHTIEGNTGPDGTREGYGVFRRTRPVTDRMAFLRWQS